MSWICTIFRRILSCTLALLQLIHRAIPQNDIQSNFIHDSKKETNRKETISTVCRSEFKSLASGLHQRCKLYKCCHHRSSGFVSATASHFSREKNPSSFMLFHCQEILFSFRLRPCSKKRVSSFLYHNASLIVAALARAFPASPSSALIISGISPSNPSAR